MPGGPAGRRPRHFFLKKKFSDVNGWGRWSATIARGGGGGEFTPTPPHITKQRSAHNSARGKCHTGILKKRGDNSAPRIAPPPSPPPVCGGPGAATRRPCVHPRRRPLTTHLFIWCCCRRSCSISPTLPNRLRCCNTPGLWGAVPSLGMPIANTVPRPWPPPRPNGACVPAEERGAGGGVTQGSAFMFDQPPCPGF